MTGAITPMLAEHPLNISHRAKKENPSYDCETKNLNGRPVTKERKEGKKEGNILFIDTLNTFYFTVIWCQTYGKGPLR